MSQNKTQPDPRGQPPLQASPWTRRLRLAGLAATLLCCAYIGFKLVENKETITRLYELGIARMVFLALLWIAVNAMLGCGWAGLVRLLGKGAEQDIGILASVALSFRTQAAKYLPGNVFHFAGRVMLAPQVGIGKTTASLATLAEAVTLVLAALVLGISHQTVLPWSLHEETAIRGSSVPGLLITILILIFLSLVLGSTAAKATRILPKWNPLARQEDGLRGTQAPLRRMTAAFGVVGAYTVVFILQAFMFQILLQACAPEASWTFCGTLSAIALSWAAGFLVIGSPGGLGIREVVLLQFAASGQEPAILLCAALLRVCSILGDMSALLLSFTLPLQPANPKDSCPHEPPGT